MCAGSNCIGERTSSPPHTIFVLRAKIMCIANSETFPASSTAILPSTFASHFRTFLLTPAQHQQALYQQKLFTWLAKTLTAFQKRNEKLFCCKHAFIRIPHWWPILGKSPGCMLHAQYALSLRSKQQTPIMIRTAWYHNHFSAKTAVIWTSYSAHHW